VNGQETLNATNFVNAVAEIKPGQNITLVTDKGMYILTTVPNPDNASKGFMGIGSFQQKTGITNSVEKNYGNFLPQILVWINLLILWLFIINVGIALFNLLPLGIVDGGRMFYVASLAIFRDEKKAMKALGGASMIILLLIAINLLPWLTKLLSFISAIF
jgi:membrane-associated protease RseP (regulator of RpoE activity)